MSIGRLPRVPDGQGSTGVAAGPVLDIRGLTKGYGERGRSAPAVLDDLTLQVQQRELVCIVGASGCGKTTLLRTVAGLLGRDSGEVLVCGKPVQAPPAELAVVFQEYGRSLLPWLSVAGNVALPLRYRAIGKRERRGRVEEALTSVGLWDVRDKAPWELSGGMQQRVAIARALAYRPALLVMDEPFASVDAQTRAGLEDLILRLWAEQDMTVLLVTHDVDEAVYLADRVVVLSSGPARGVAQLAVDLPRPRHQLATRALPGFSALRAQVFHALGQSGTSAPPAAGDGPG